MNLIETVVGEVPDPVDVNELAQISREEGLVNRYPSFLNLFGKL